MICSKQRAEINSRSTEKYCSQMISLTNYAKKYTHNAYSLLLKYRLEAMEYVSSYY